MAKLKIIGCLVLRSIAAIICTILIFIIVFSIGKSIVTFIVAIPQSITLLFDFLMHNLPISIIIVSSLFVAIIIIDIIWIIWENKKK